VSSLTLILFIGALILGTLGYIEKIFDLKLSRRFLIGFLILFILISAGQFILSSLKDSELRKQIDPRQLTDKQAEYIVTLIKDKSPGEVWLSCKAGDEEARKFGEQIFKILKIAEWRIINDALMDVGIYQADASSIVGIVITINKDLKSIPSGIELFHKTMLQFGFASRINGSSKSGVEVWIGAKPQIIN